MTIDNMKEVMCTVCNGTGGKPYECRECEGKGVWLEPLEDSPSGLIEAVREALDLHYVYPQDSLCEDTFCPVTHEAFKALDLIHLELKHLNETIEDLIAIKDIATTAKRGEEMTMEATDWTKIKLLHCPFCGSRASNGTEEFKQFNGKTWTKFQIFCSCCFATVDSQIDYYDAAEVWNRRVK